MPEPTELDVGYVAQLARLKLSDEERQLFEPQLREVLRHVEVLKQADVREIEPAAHAVPIFNVFREDEPRDWFTADDALKAAPRQANGLFIVTKVVG